MSVGIPGTGSSGIHIAAALGAIAGNADLNLEVLRDATIDDVEEAKKWLVMKKSVYTYLKEMKSYHIEAICHKSVKNRLK